MVTWSGNVTWCIAFKCKYICNHICTTYLRTCKLHCIHHVILRQLLVISVLHLLLHLGHYPRQGDNLLPECALAGLVEHSCSIVRFPVEIALLLGIWVLQSTDVWMCMPHEKEHIRDAWTILTPVDIVTTMYENCCDEAASDQYNCNLYAITLYQGKYDTCKAGLHVFVVIHLLQVKIRSKEA